MRVLRLTNSSDFDKSIPPGSRQHAVISRILTAQLGTPVEVIAKPIWPDMTLIRKLAEWLDEYEPEILQIKLNTYWLEFETVTRKLEREFGRMGRVVATGSDRVAHTPPLRRTPLFRQVRRAMLSTVGGLPPLDVTQVVETIEACVRLALRKEDICVLVHQRGVTSNLDGGKRSQARALARRKEMYARLTPTLDRLHVYHRFELVPPETFQESYLRQNLGEDRVHPNEARSISHGEWEAALVLEAWRAFNVGSDK